MTQTTAEILFKTLQEAMAEDWKRQKIGSFGDMKTRWQKQLKTLESIHELYLYEQNDSSREEKQEEEEGVNDDGESAYLAAGPALETSATAEGVPAKEDEPESYPFQRNLRGGVLVGHGGVVPEGVVRRLGLEHGDMVVASPHHSRPRQTSRYHYEIVERRSEVDTRGRCQYNLCKVEEIAGRLVVRQSMEQGFIKCNGDMMPLTINDYEAENFSLEPGDLIDIAFFESEPNRMKVLWKHRIEDLPEPPAENASDHKVAPKKKIEEPIKEQVLQGMKILVVGEEHKRQYYQLELSKYGGELLFADGKMNSGIVKQQSAKADIVVCVTSRCSHDGMYASRDEAKRLGVPFIPFPTDSAQSIAKAVVELVKERKAS